MKEIDILKINDDDDDEWRCYECVKCILTSFIMIRCNGFSSFNSFATADAYMRQLFHCHFHTMIRWQQKG